MSKATALDHLLNEVNRAASSGFPLLAIAMAVALPDICVSLISDDGRTDRWRYKAWCDENVKDVFTYVTADDLYSLRCGVVHSGRFGDLKHNVDAVLFVPPHPNRFFRNCKMEDSYLYSVVGFCEDMTDAVRKWQVKNERDENFIANIGRLMQYRPPIHVPLSGLMPVIG